MAELSLVGIEHGARQASEVQGQGLPGHSVSQQASQSVCLCLSVIGLLASQWGSQSVIEQSVSQTVSQSVSQSVSQPVMGGQTVRQEEGKEAQGPLPAGYQGPELD